MSQEFRHGLSGSSGSGCFIKMWSRCQLKAWLGEDSLLYSLTWKLVPCGLLNWSLNIGHRPSSDPCHSILFLGELTTMWQLTWGEQMSKEGRQGGSERDWFGSQSILKLDRVKQITSPGWMHETSAWAWCTGKTQREQVEGEGGSGWGTHANPWLIHVNVWQKPLQYC